MADNLKDLVKKLIMGRCRLKEGWPLDFSQTNPIFIPIKNEQVSFSREIDSLEDADSCMLFFTYFSDNTVPDRYKPYEFVTFRNSYYEFGYINSQGELCDNYEDDEGFAIRSYSNRTCELCFKGIKLMNIDVTEEKIKNLWQHYQFAKKCVKILQNDFEKTRLEMSSKIEVMTAQYNNLNEKYKEIATSLKTIANSID